MPNCKKILQKALDAPQTLRFTELCQLAECFGWRFARQKGAHRLYKRSGSIELMNFQDDQGMAKAYQVRQLVRALDELGLIPEDLS